MQKKRKKFWIIFGSIFVTITMLCLVFSIAMRLKTIDVEFRMRLSEDQTVLDNSITEDIKKYFKLNKNIVFYSTDEAVDQIEKDYPFIKVNQVVKSFPNIMRVYISERIPKFRVIDSTNNNQFLILDADFKVIDTILVSELETNGTYGNTNYSKKTIEIIKDDFNISVQNGNFVTGHDSIKNSLNDIASGIYGKTEDYASVRLIKIKTENNELKYYINMKNISAQNQEGCNILVDGTTDLKQKAFIGVTTFEEEVKGDSSLNTPTVIIRIENYNGTYYGIKGTVPEGSI